MVNETYKVGKKGRKTTVHVEHGYVAGQCASIRIVAGDGEELVLEVENPLGMIETMKIEPKKT